MGIGSTQHLSGELLQSMAGIHLNHVPYRGGAAPLQDVIGGVVDMMFDSVTVTRAQIETGKLRAIGLTSAKSWPTLPTVPPLQKSLPGYEVMSWLGVAAPRGLPTRGSENPAAVNPAARRLAAELDVREAGTAAIIGMAKAHRLICAAR